MIKEKKVIKVPITITFDKKDGGTATFDAYRTVEITGEISKKFGRALRKLSDN